MELSIIILTYNQREATIKCLESLRNIDAEIILIDNGSTDNTREYILEFFPNVKLVCNDDNRGVAAGRNIGLKIAKGEWLMILDNDTIVTQPAIESLLTFIKQNPSVGLVAPALCDENGILQQSFKPYPGIREKLKNLFSKKSGIVDHSITEKEIEPFYVIGACQLFNSQLLDEIGFLDENIFYGPEDADFCIRVRQAGKRVVYLPHISIIHLWRRTSSRKLFSLLAYRHLMGLIYFWRKHKQWL